MLRYEDVIPHIVSGFRQIEDLHGGDREVPGHREFVIALRDIEALCGDVVPVA